MVPNVTHELKASVTGRKHLNISSLDPFAQEMERRVSNIRNVCSHFDKLNNERYIFHPNVLYLMVLQYYSA